MHQTFYIDIDEEITSIIERLKKSKTKEVVIVVPKRALLIQSIINLKLLKKEADKLKKEIIIVTQDKLGKLLVEKTGIIVEQRMDEVGGEEIVSSKDQAGANVVGEFAEDKKGEAEISLENLGSTEYFNALPKKNRRQVLIKSEEKGAAEKILNKELVTNFNSETRNKFFSKNTVQSLDMVKNIDIKQKGQKEDDDIILPAKKGKNEIFKKDNFPIEENEDEKDLFSNRKAEEFFSRSERAARVKEKEEYKNVQVGGKAWKIFFVFCSIIILAGIFAGGYLYLPKASIAISPKTEIKSVGAELKGLTDINEPDFTGQAIPVKIVDIENEITKNFDSTGNKSDSSKKARGTITIYNEFSSSPQTLVATTRFLSENGKIFRLDKSIVVPGTTQIGGEIKPGAIEAQVTADEAGEKFNIEATRFSIPGFQGSGSEKFNKIYAKSSKSMQGGGAAGESIKSISPNDVSVAKDSLGKELIAGLKQKVKNEQGEDYIVLDDATNFGNIIYTLSAPEGTVSDSFALTAKAKASVFVFKKSQLESFATNKLLSSTGIKAERISKNSLKFEFGKADADFASGVILIRVNIKAKILPDLNLSTMKEDILGKNEEELRAYLSHYKEIESINIDYRPSFLSGKIPQYASRVDLALDNN